VRPRLRESTLFDEANIIGEDLGVIEREGRWGLAGEKEADRFGVVLGDRRACGAANINHTDGLTTGIAAGARVDAEEGVEFDVKGDFLARFAESGLLDSLAEINEAAGNSPSVGNIFALDQDDAVADFGDNVGGYRRAYGTRHASQIIMGEGTVLQVEAVWKSNRQFGL
jgi:hypothetical protein